MSVCDSQDDFNHAFQKAVKYVNKKNQPSKMAQLVILGLVLVLVVWAIMLAMKSGGDQKLHLILAMVFSPFYIISYYLDSMKQY